MTKTIHGLRLVYHNQGILYQMYLRIATKRSPHQLLPFQIRTHQPPVLEPKKTENDIMCPFFQAFLGAQILFWSVPPPSPPPAHRPRHMPGPRQQQCGASPCFGCCRWGA